MSSVLIVEDEPLLRNAVSEKLSKEFECFSANDGHIGLQLAIQKHPDVILLDLVMPKYDGLQMLKKLRADSWGKTARVIVLTNLSDERSMEEAKQLNILFYLIKANLKLEDVLQYTRDAVVPKGQNI